MKTKNKVQCPFCKTIAYNYYDLFEEPEIDFLGAWDMHFARGMTKEQIRALEDEKGIIESAKCKKCGNTVIVKYEDPVNSLSTRFAHLADKIRYVEPTK